MPLFNTPKRISLNALLPEVYINPLDQKRLEYFMQKFPQMVTSAYDQAAFRFARQVLAIVRKAISTGMPPPGGGVSWAPLAASTMKNYTRWGHSNAHPWYVLGQMLREVNIQRNNKNRYYVGFPRGVAAKNPNPNGKGKRPSLSALAKMLESGNDYRPGRPLFNPAFKSAGGKPRLQKFMVEELKKAFRSSSLNPLRNYKKSW